MTGVAFVDTETLGLDPFRHPIWETAIILPDGPDAGEHVWQTYVSPSQIAHAEPIALEITGFHERYDRIRALYPAQSAERVARLLDGRHIVGAVPSFDEERLRLQHRRCGRPERYPWHYHLIDVEAMAVGALCAERAAWREGWDLSLPWKSEVLGVALGVEPTPEAERHTALGDARWARRMYEEIVG